MGKPSDPRGHLVTATDSQTGMAQSITPPRRDTLLVHRRTWPAGYGGGSSVEEVPLAIASIKLTFEEYCALPETVLPHELIDGGLRMPAAPIRRHQETSGNLYAPLRHHVRSRRLGRVLYTPVDVVLDRERPHVVQPDLLFVRIARLEILSDKVYGAPDLVVEILSPGGETFDRTEKAALYAQYGVREYWLVDPSAEAIEVRRLAPSGQEVLGMYCRGDTFRSRVLPDFTMPVDDAFAE